jgi:tripartite-type tricarboxylate transporter receptor subunit TctC
MLRNALKSLFAGAALAAALVLGLAAPASAQNWPTRQITIIVPYAAGGGLDFVARLIADDLTKRLNWTVVVENRGGANGTIGAAAVARAAPDGYTFMMNPSGPLVNAKLLSEGLSYNPDTDFTPIMKLVYSPIVLVTNKDVPAKTLKDLVAYAKANPGALNVGNSGPNSTQELMSMMFASGTGIEITRVPYKGSGQILPDILANRIQLMLDFPAAYMGNVRSNDLRFLATLNATRLEAFPDVPTVAEAGFPEVPAWQGWFGMFGPKGLPDAIRERVFKEISTFLNSPEAKQKLATGGYLPTPEGPESALKLMQGETEALTKLIHKYNINKTAL